jgi:hypothetical protein
VKVKVKVKGRVNSYTGLVQHTFWRLCQFK